MSCSRVLAGGAALCNLPGARGSGDLDAVEVVNAWRCFLEELFGVFELSFHRHLGSGSFLGGQAWQEGEECEE
jgi:hypothetical protein